MSGKFEKKKATAGNKQTQSGKKQSSGGKKLLWALLIALAALLAVLLVLAYFWEIPDDNAQTSTGDTQGSESVAIGTFASETGADSAGEISFHLGSEVYITNLHKYTGAYMEDNSNEVVTDVLAIEITNSGEEYIQYMEILLTDGETTATFVLSTLMPGDTVLVLEQNRMAYSDAPAFTSASSRNVALFRQEPSLCEDKVEIQCLNGVLNITNVSGEDIEGDIVIYYKNQINGVFYGGITYRLRIQGGLKAGEIRQGAAAYFNTSNSTVVFVTIG